VSSSGILTLAIESIARTSLIYNMKILLTDDKKKLSAYTVKHMKLILLAANVLGGRYDGA
jgi:hypothetical protein